MVSNEFSIRTVDNCVVVLQMNQTPTTEGWEVFKTAFLRIYQKYPHFVLIFDVSRMGFPSFDLINRTKTLIFSLKSRSCRQLLGTIVITAFEPIKAVIENLVQSAGQAAPFYAYTSVEEAAATAAELAHILKRTPRAVQLPKGGKTWGDVSIGVRYGLIVTLFTRHIRHFIRLRYGPGRRDAAAR